MVKIQIIEKLFYIIVTYSYLVLPLGLLLLRHKRKEIIPLSIGLYGIICFILLFSYNYLPKEDRKIFQIFYTFIEYSFFTFFLWKNIVNKKFRRFIIILSGLFLLFQVLNYFNAPLVRLDSVPIGIETILILIYVLYFFYEFLKVIFLR